MSLQDKCPNCGSPLADKCDQPERLAWVSYRCGASRVVGHNLVTSLLCTSRSEANTLRADKERLDWLEKERADVWFPAQETGGVAISTFAVCCVEPTLREAIDKAMGRGNNSDLRD